jgi:hypothetical protein
MLLARMSGVGERGARTDADSWLAATNFDACSTCPKSRREGRVLESNVRNMPG